MSGIRKVITSLLAGFTIMSYGQTICLKGVEITCPTCTPQTNSAACVCKPLSVTQCHCLPASGPQARETCYDNFFEAEESITEAWVLSEPIFLCAVEEECRYARGEEQSYCGPYVGPPLNSCIPAINLLPCQWDDFDIFESIWEYVGPCDE